MKKLIVFVTVIIFGCSSNTNSDSATSTVKTKSENIEQEGELVYKKRQIIGTINNCLVSVMNIYDFNLRDTIKTLQFEYTYLGNTYRNEINKKELELMIEGYKYALDTLAISNGDESGMLQFYSKKGIEAGAFHSKSINKWQFFIQIAPQESNSTIFMNDIECEALLAFLGKIKM
jgi:hypothetical protein